MTLCPRCDVPLMHKRQRRAVPVEVCRLCDGVWLDRGKLDRLLAESQAGSFIREKRANKLARKKFRDNGHRTGKEEKIYEFIGGMYRPTRDPDQA